MAIKMYFILCFLPIFVSTNPYLCNKLIPEGKYVKQDMFMYMGIIRVKEGNEMIKQQPYCMHITADISIPSIYNQMGFTQKETINLFAFKRFKEIKDFDFKLEILN